MASRFAFTHRIALTALGLAAGLAAQASYVVDAKGGAGSNFRTIAAAIDKATDGDTILVRAGIYAPFTLIKSLAIVGAPGATVRVPTALARGTVVAGIKAGTTATLRGLHFDIGVNLTVTNILHLLLNPGRVHLSSLTFTPSSAAPTNGVQIETSAAVSMDGCNVPQPVRIDRSGFAGTDTRFDRPTTLFGTIPLTLTGSRVVLTRCSATGPILRFDGLSAIEVNASTLALRGDGSGGYFKSTFSKFATIAGDATSVLIRDPKIRLSDPKVSGFRTSNIASMPWLIVTGGNIGGTATVEFGAAPRASYRLFAGLPGPRIPLPGLGDVWVDTRAFAQIAQGVIGASGVVTSQRSVPNAPALIGLTVTYQVLRSNSTGASLSNPGTVTLF